MKDGSASQINLSSATPKKTLLSRLSSHDSRNGNPSLLLTIPAYNERECIGDVVRAAREALPQADVLVIDDGSSDDTAQQAALAGAIVVRHPFNLGIGGTVQTGLKFAKLMDYDIVLRIDGDGQHDPDTLPLLLAPVQLGEADVVVGSRFLNDKVDMRIPFLRRLGICLFAREVSWLTGCAATDTTSGMTVMNRHALELLARYMPQDYPEVESRIILQKGGLVVKEVPVRMRERVAGISSINSWRSIYYAFKVSIAVLLTAMKRIPRKATEITDVHRAPAASSLS